MPIRVTWDKYEVALLFRAYEMVSDGGDINEVAVSLSETLRNLALRRGVSIDDTYRNVNGMKMQLANVQYVFTNGEKGLSGASLLIRQMFQIYRHNHTEYNDILKEAIRLTGEAMSVEESFYAYADGKISLSPSQLADYLKKATAYSHSKQPILGMTDAMLVRNLLDKIDKGKLLRFRFGKDSQKIREVMRLYYMFVKTYQEPKNDDFNPPLTKSSVSKKSGDGEEINHIEETGTQVTIIDDIMAKVEEPQGSEVDTPSSNNLIRMDSSVAKEDENEENKNVVSEADTQVTISNDIIAKEKGPQGNEADILSQDNLIWMEFSHNSDYLHTKPVQYIYKGEVHEATSWINLYVELCGFLMDDYHVQFMQTMNSDLPGYKSLAFADEQHKDNMRKACAFAPGYYIESDMDSTNIVRRIYTIMQLFGLSKELQIFYKKEDKDSTITATDKADEWIIGQLKARGLTYQDKRSMEDCLWIVGGHELDSFSMECKAKGYILTFKADGSKTYPNQAVWWTKDSCEQKIDTSDFRSRLNEKFRYFLVSKKQLAKRTADSYCQSIEAVERFLIKNKLDYTLDIDDSDKAQHIFDILLSREDFVNWNISRHHQYSAALGQYVAYLNQVGNIDSGNEQNRQDQRTIIETVFDVLHKAGKPMTVSEISQVILRDNLNSFGAQNPKSVVYSKIMLACMQTDVRIKEGRDVLICTELDGQKMFQVMSAQEAVAYLQGRVENNEVENSSPWEKYEAVLKQAFPKGFQKESGLDLKKLRKRWAEIQGEVLGDSDNAIRLQLAAHCVDTGKRWYLAELLLCDNDRQMVIEYIDRVLDSGKRVLYYSSIYAALEHRLESTVLTEDLLVSYLKATCQKRYILREHYLTNDFNAQVDLCEEIKDVMLAHGRPIHTDELKQTLHHLPPGQVERELHTHAEFIMDAFHMYFHESMADLTDNEINQIAAIIQKELDNQGYMIGNGIQQKLAQLYPETAERLSFLTQLGVRGAVAYKLRTRFSFSGPVITSKGMVMNMIDIFAMFCQHHTPFTLDDLTAFAKECGSTIYLDTVHLNCARVSETEFVSAEAVSWDIPHVDAAIALHCPGKYVSLKSIQYFEAFPFVGYSWNSYLLEQYVATVSKEFMLMHSSYAKNNTSGAIVRRAAKLEAFDEVLADALANASVALEKDPCLSYLVDAGFISRRKLSSLNEIITRAKMLRSQKG